MVSKNKNALAIILLLFMGCLLLHSFSSYTSASGRQLTDTVVMVPPTYFLSNPETRPTNYFQIESLMPENRLRSKAMFEYRRMVKSLRKAGINVIQMQSPQGKITPDAVFPNNWFLSIEPEYPTSSGANFQTYTNISLFQMLAENRRAEVNPEGLDSVLKQAGIRVSDGMMDFRGNGMGVLEGTGSMVIDRKASVIYAAVSSRTSIHALSEFASSAGFHLVAFHTGQDKEEIYHTNVIMSIGDGFAVLCAACIENEEERSLVLEKLAGREVIQITGEQVKMMAGNILQLRNKNGRRFIVMSNQAQSAFSDEQLLQLKEHGHLLIVSIPTIETYGGGSARCMMAEIFYD